MKATDAIKRIRDGVERVRVVKLTDSEIRAAIVEMQTAAQGAEESENVCVHKHPQQLAAERALRKLKNAIGAK